MRMKKFLLTSLAALFAVVSFAQSRALKYEPIQVNNVFTGKVEKRVEALKPMPKSVKAQANPFAKKNLRRGAAIGSVDELQGEFILLNYDYDYDSTLVEEIPNRSASALTIEAVDEKTVMIYGMWDADKGITATVDLENDKLIIPAGQVIGTSSSYGDIYLGNAEAEDVNEPLTATIYAGSFIVIDQLWFTWIVYQEKNTRWGPYSASMIALANGIHECTVTDEESGKPVQAACNVFIEQDDSTKAVTVWNYNPDWNLVVDIDIYADKTFMVPEQTVYYTSNYGEFALYGISGRSLVDLVGTVSDTELSSDIDVYVYQLGLGGWPAGTFGKITLIDGSTFDIPEVEKGELVTPPAGLQTRDYPFSATGWYNAAQVNQGPFESTVKIGIDGNNVYIQGLDKDLPDAWVKGEFNEDKTKVAFPVTYTGLVGESEAHYFAAYGGSEGPDSLTVNYDADADTYDYGATVMIYKGSATTAFVYFYNGFFIGVKPTPTVAPEGLKTTEMPLAGQQLNYNTGEWDAVEGKVNVGFDGEDVYIQNLFAEVENGWIKGAIVKGDSAQYVVFDKNQYVGNLENGLSAYLVGYMPALEDGQDASAGPVVFLYDSEKQLFTSIYPIILTRFKDNVNISRAEACFVDLVIGTDPTGIAIVKSDVKANGQMYNLAGQKVGKDYKGMVIVNGRKFMNK